jgi:hypothetical protein
MMSNVDAAYFSRNWIIEVMSPGRQAVENVSECLGDVA